MLIQLLDVCQFVILAFVAFGICCFSRWRFVGLLLQILSLQCLLHLICVASAVECLSVCYYNVCQCNVCCIRYVWLQPLNVCRFVASDMCCFSRWTFVSLSFQRVSHLIFVTQALDICWFVIATFVASDMCCFSC